MTHKNIIILFLLTITAIFSTIVISETSFAQTQLVQNSIKNNTIDDNTDLTNNTNQNLTISNSNPLFSNSYFKNFRMDNDTDKWNFISGSWNYTLEGLHGGSNEKIVNNIALSPIITSGNQFNIKTLFKINDLEKGAQNSTAIVYSFTDKRNYQQAGINILNDDIYVILSNAVDNKFNYDLAYPGLKTNLKWKPGTVFNMTLSIEGNSKHLFINDTKYSFDNNNDSIDGFIGLSYGGIKSIDFNNFEITNTTSNQTELQSINTTSNQTELQDITTPSETIIDTSPSSDNKTNLIEGVVVSDSQSILLEDYEIPEESYIHLYDTTPYKILNGHVAAKLPCNADNSTNVQVLVGQAPKLEVANLEFIPQFSVSGDLCLYHLDLESTTSDNTITDIAIQNNSTSDITFPPTSTIVIDINKISKIT